MGPMLFTLYVNDLFRVPKHCESLGYVDDTKLFLGFPTSELDDVISAVNEDLKYQISISNIKYRFGAVEIRCSLTLTKQSVFMWASHNS